MNIETYAIIADIHGNYPALEAVLWDMRRFAPKWVICLGDIVGYGPDSVECSETLKSIGADLIMGNHESMLLGLTSDEHCSQLGKESARYTRETITNMGLLDWLRAFPYNIKHGEIMFTHNGFPYDDDWAYLNSAEDIKGAIESAEASVTFYAHTHRYRLSGIDTNGRFTDCLTPEQSNWKLELKCKYLINAGSVGQARYDKTRADYVLLQVSGVNRNIEFRHIEYDSFEAYKRFLRISKKQADYLIREDWRREQYGSLIDRR